MRFAAAATAAGALALIHLAAADATGVTITEVFTVTPADCVASMCDPSSPSGTQNALSVLESAAATFSSSPSLNALSVLLSAYTLETPITFPSSAFPTPIAPGPSTSVSLSSGPASPVSTAGSASTESSQTSTGPTGVVPAPTYGDTTTTTVSDTVHSTATAPEASSDTGVPTAPGPPVTSDTAAPPATTLTTSSTTTTTADSITDSETGTATDSATSSSTTTSAPPQQTGAAITIEANAIALFAAMAAALVYA